jgi:hypothetical protein
MLIMVVSPFGTINIITIILLRGANIVINYENSKKV